MSKFIIIIISIFSKQRVVTMREASIYSSFVAILFDLYSSFLIYCHYGYVFFVDLVLSNTMLSRWNMYSKCFYFCYYFFYFLLGLFFRSVSLIFDPLFCWCFILFFINLFLPLLFILFYHHFVSSSSNLCVRNVRTIPMTDGIKNRCICIRFNFIIVKGTSVITVQNNTYINISICRKPFRDCASWYFFSRWSFRRCFCQNLPYQNVSQIVNNYWI